METSPIDTSSLNMEQLSNSVNMFSFWCKNSKHPTFDTNYLVIFGTRNHSSSPFEASPQEEDLLAIDVAGLLIVPSSKDQCRVATVAVIDPGDRLKAKKEVEFRSFISKNFVWVEYVNFFQNLWRSSISWHLQVIQHNIYCIMASWCFVAKRKLSSKAPDFTFLQSPKRFQQLGQLKSYGVSTT